MTTYAELAVTTNFSFLRGASHPEELVTRAQEEMLLFYEVLSRAEKTLTISFPALDERGQVLVQSVALGWRAGTP